MKSGRTRGGTSVELGGTSMELGEILKPDEVDDIVVDRVGGFDEFYPKIQNWPVDF